MTQNEDNKTTQPSRLYAVLSWVATLILVFAILSILLWQPKIAAAMSERQNAQPVVVEASSEEMQIKALENMPYFAGQVDISTFIPRSAILDTDIEALPRMQPVTYQVEAGDALFGIAKYFNVTPETVLWANYAVLNDNPHLLSIGQELTVPPTNGILYKWVEGDTLDSVAAKYYAEVEDILVYPGNRLDFSDPQIEPGSYIMIPGGSREIVQWVVPTIARGKSGTSGSIGNYLCDSSTGAMGTGNFIWPSYNHVLSGNDYWSGHLAIDIAIGLGDLVWASDSGVVVYAGSYPLYGNTVLIDHGNGYQTLYAHLNDVTVYCGSSVYQGQTIGHGGSTGNSTGPHLHFEIRYMSGFVNPWSYLQ